MHMHMHTHTQPHEAAEENGFLELANYLRGLCGLPALDRLPDADEEAEAMADLVVDLNELAEQGNDNDNDNPNEPMAE